MHSPIPKDGMEQSDPNTNPLIIWIFNPDIYYSCSAYDGSGILPQITSQPHNADNPHSHDTSQIYSESTVELPYRNASGPDAYGKAAEVVPELKDHGQTAGEPARGDLRNPNQDDVSQIYGPPEGPQVVAGDLQFEIPLPDRQSKDDVDNLAPHINPITDTETPFVSAKSTERTETIAQPSQQQNLATNGSMNEHINLVHRAAKIFYKPLPNDTTPTSFLDTNSTTHEELYLSSPAELAELRATLQRSNAMLPASAKVFQEWKVGLLDRYEKNPTGLSVMQENPLARGVKVKDGRVTRWSIGDGAEGLYA